MECERIQIGPENTSFCLNGPWKAPIQDVDLLKVLAFIFIHVALSQHIRNILKLRIYL